MEKSNKYSGQPQMIILAPGMAKFSTGPKRPPKPAEKHDPSSRTIPDDSFTIKELFDRYKKGAPLPLGIERPVSYGDSPTHNDLDYSSISRMDLTAVADYKKRVSDTLVALTQRQNEIKEADLARATRVAEASPSLSTESTK